MYTCQHGLILFTVLAAASGCDNASSSAATVTTDDNQALTAYIEKFKQGLVQVDGGTFLMGDFGAEYGPEKLYYDADHDSRPLHEVELSPFRITKFKITNEQYQSYLKHNKLKAAPASNMRMQERMDSISKVPDIPAHVNWYDAEKYCNWMAEITGEQVTLPTEAQWEYAARSRGLFHIVPTDDGTLRFKDNNGEWGINVAGSGDIIAYSEKAGNQLAELSPMPVGLYPPNQLGIYDMAGNGFEWVSDWYDPDYYKNSPRKDPQGPARPTFKNSDGKTVKVLRGQDFSGPGKGLTVSRSFRGPDNDGYTPLDKTFRCVVNSKAE
ncbi:SUMF1/EgtB/PvdO family nonheme iron enzyme [Brenneria goodwinii]|uniref:formylglycine-generating enzyme family protein n=1 Tax=Brenneria goodwinii TaxID=1109412 RepID=UPI000EF24FEB|nr:SUMF1/EgtB/PvdO family nonheme iron enzyme [Brenneria goodwinii]MCG8159162.1 SUMF1/EgtB/PvdO family nonheme iron enzyme [Brenneria goodwinii]MCG8163755.1 SUMF1/EgtB/PvdO family nonheme iron enzyme [Brenneria goodwinii]MCG8168393.1 SUMF1/EgtB/PvdO family nonheme iron enzyme [Brenneria goodwinii]MCG8171243.1 SUMF1/EgtB/PvdO family nonheme iron enzyme [Brenneria goodwinii]MCG8177663.1 SUMF1/EgtB/PvdO family nonheme iron enzyme [Brenneria goodwinii]